MITSSQLQDLTTNPTPQKRVSIIKTTIIKENRTLYGAKQINTPKLASELAHTLFQGTDREMLIVASLDAKCNPLSLEIASIGNINTCIVSPREIFKSSILSNAVHIIIFHNHLSGDCTPSSEDLSVTKRLIDVGELLGIPLLDHLILGDDSCFLSLRESGFLNFPKNSQLYLKEF